MVVIGLTLTLVFRGLRCVEHINFSFSDVEIKSDYVFVARTNKFSRQPMSRNMIAAVTKFLATFLNFENPEPYTGHPQSDDVLCS